MSHKKGVRTQEISDTVGHKSTHVTETVYRQAIVSAIGGAASWDRVCEPEDVTGNESYCGYDAEVA
jgi:hypothetical protein